MKKYQVKIAGHRLTVIATSVWAAISAALDAFPDARCCSARLAV
jgi:hypothetical protein